jgi:hypothetical protein
MFTTCWQKHAQHNNTQEYEAKKHVLARIKSDSKRQSHLGDISVKSIGLPGPHPDLRYHPQPCMGGDACG